MKENGWIITKEFAEKGVSGYKVSAKDRDAILEIQKDAVQNKFDVLLVFMFDRIGRREDETPFVVEWFVKNGIEVWSTQEGQQKIENHVDKLMNYIRYWQASGESLKTSIRTKTRLGQIVQEGHFRGGTPSYGFQIVKKGRIGKKNKELYDIEINPAEAPAIRRMFDLADKYGFGGRRISSELKAEGIINLRTGEPFHYSTIQNALKNIMNAGVLRSGETYSDVFPELQIVPMDQFLRVKKGLNNGLVRMRRNALTNIMRWSPLKAVKKLKLTVLPEMFREETSGKRFYQVTYIAVTVVAAFLHLQQEKATIRLLRKRMSVSRFINVIIGHSIKNVAMGQQAIGRRRLTM